MPKVQIRENRNRNVRAVLYNKMKKEGDGVVACFVCGKHVEWCKATLEHKIPKSKGGASNVGNYAISHHYCNVRRGNDASVSFVSGEAAA